MAPKRKKKTTEAPRGSDAATLIAQCPRAALEELALRMFDQPGSVSRKDLEEAAAACRPKAPKVISVGDDRKGTGAFDVVSGDVLARILLALPIQDRYRIAICVCKAWRRLRSAHGPKNGLFFKRFASRRPNDDLRAPVCGFGTEGIPGCCYFQSNEF